MTTPLTSTFLSTLGTSRPSIIGGRYRLIKPLGRGASATVYLAVKDARRRWCSGVPSFRRTCRPICRPCPSGAAGCARSRLKADRGQERPVKVSGKHLSERQVLDHEAVSRNLQS